MQDPGYSSLPFAERWTRVGNPVTDQQITAARIALRTPASRGQSRQSREVERFGKQYFSRTATSLKLEDEFRQTQPEAAAPRRRASTIEAGSPLRRVSVLKSLAQEVHTELPRWKSVSAGSQVQVLDRPDFLGRVERGLQKLYAKEGRFKASPVQATLPSSEPGSPTSPGASPSNRSRKGTEGSAREEDNEVDEARQRRIRKLESVRLRDQRTGMFDDHSFELSNMSASVPNLSSEILQDETWKSLNEFNKKVQAQARRSLYSLGARSSLAKLSKSKILSIEDEEKVDHFWAWCKETFGTLAKAFQAFDLNGNGQLSSVEFAEGCRARGYPGNATTYKRIFFLMDADLDGVIGKPEFSGSKIKRSSMWQGSGETSKTDQQSTMSVNPFDKMGNSAARKSVLTVKRQVMIGDLYKQDPPISQFIEFLFSAYTTLKEAFRQIDINRNGLLSKSEFKDGLRILRVGKMNLLDKHLDDLFDRLDYDRSGHIDVDEMTEVSTDPFILRLVKYLLDVRSDFHVKQEKESSMTKQQRLARVFNKLDDNMNKEIDREEFVAALKRLRYLDWHVGDLFDRLDRDRSGQLSVEEFSAFLEKDRKAKVTTTESVGTESSLQQLDDPSAQAARNFQEKFETGAFSVVFSSKLQKIGTRSGHTADLIRMGDSSTDPKGHDPSKGPVSSTVGWWTTDDSGGFAQRFQRGRDYCEEVRNKLKRPDGSPRKSLMRLDGCHSYGASLRGHDHSHDHLPLCVGLDHMTQREEFARSRVTF